MVLALFWTSALADIREKSPCPPSDEIAESLKTRSFNLQLARDNLQHLLDGRILESVSPGALFSIDLSDEQAVEKRAGQIKAMLDTPETPVESVTASDTLLSCAFQDEKFREKVEAVLKLQKDVETLRLTFLVLEKNKRASLLKLQTDALKTHRTIENFTLEKESATSMKHEADKSVDIAEQKALTEKNQDLRDLAARRVLIEKFKSGLSQNQIQWFSDMEKQTAFYQGALKQIAAIGAKNLRQAEDSAVRKDYHEALSLWRALVDKTFRYSDPNPHVSNLPEIPDLPSDLLARLSGSSEVEDYRASYNEAVDQRKAFLDKATFQFESDLKNHYTVLLQAGQARSRLLHELVDRGDDSPVAMNQDYVNDIIREVKIVPFRWLSIFYVKFLDVKHKLKSGFNGIFALVREGLSFLAFMTIPFFLWLGVKKVITSLNRLRMWLIPRQYEHRLAGPAAIWIQRLLPYIPWILVLPAIGIARKLIENTVFAEMALFLPYIEYYSYYRMFRLLIASGLSILSIKARSIATRDFQDKIHHSARRLGLFFLVFWVILYTIESIISQGLIYRAVSKLVFLIGLFVFGKVAAEWKGELATLLPDTLPKMAGERFVKLLEGKYGVYLCLPGFAILTTVTLFNWLSRWSERFDMYKRISASIFRRKLESTAAREITEKNNTPPDSYTQWFSFEVPEDPSLLLSPKNDLAGKLVRSIESWSQGLSEEHSAAFYGDKGTGKSCLLLRLASMVGDIPCLSLAIPPRLSTRHEVLEFFQNHLSLDLSDGFGSLMKADKNHDPLLVLVDDAHNLFHAELGGFEGFKTFLELVNAPTTNFFWCAAFNRYAWNYLYSVFGKKPYINSVMAIPPWLEADIKELIMTRHRRTDFTLSYDDILQAVGSQDRMEGVIYAESNFFRMLWQQSGGNPRAAMHLWLSSMKLKNEGLLSVGLPETPDASLLKDLPDDAHFVFAQIVRHENLSEKELVRTSNLPEGSVRQALKLGIENKILVYGRDKRYRVTIGCQKPLINYLQAKNFIYGNQ